MIIYFAFCPVYAVSELLHPKFEKGCCLIFMTETETETYADSSSNQALRQAYS